MRDVVRRVVEQQPVPLTVRARWFTGSAPPAAVTETIGPSAGDPWLPAYLAEVCGPLLEELLVAAIEKLDLSNGITSEDRQVKAVELEQAIAGLEREEERCVRDLELAREDVDRRPDARPELVAASDAELA